MLGRFAGEERFPGDRWRLALVRERGDFASRPTAGFPFQRVRSTAGGGTRFPPFWTGRQGMGFEADRREVSERRTRWPAERDGLLLF